jgi:FkbM family methyltransferase
MSKTISTNMPSIRGLLKPCYFFSPSTALRRIWLELFPRPTGITTVSLPWKISIEVDLGDAIGQEIFKQRVFDIAISEIAWRLLSPGGRVLDVGANIGYLTSLFAIRVGPTGEVHAFEPHPKVQEMLQRNIARIGTNERSSPILMHRCALGNISGNARLIETDYFQINRGTARIAENESQGEIESYAVAMEKLDHLFPQQSIDLAKVDVEGFEARVLEGAQNLLREKRIRHIIYEDHQTQPSILARLLQSAGYSVFSIGYDFFGPTLQELNREIAVNRSWESPSFLATIEPIAAKKGAGRRGWQVLAAFS